MRKIKVMERLHLGDLELFRKHKRLRVFYTYGCKCFECGVEGTKLLKTRHSDNSVHIDLYTSDMVLMTIDHIKPKSKGGTSNINNLQPMCLPCNQKKADRFE